MKLKIDKSITNFDKFIICLLLGTSTEVDVGITTVACIVYLIWWILDVYQDNIKLQAEYENLRTPEGKSE